MKKSLLSFLCVMTMVISSAIGVSAKGAKDAKQPVLNKTTVVEHAQNHVYLKVKNISKKTKVQWSTSNKKMATVDKTGAVWLIKPGKVTAMAKVNGKTLKCQITAKTNIQLNSEFFYLNVGKQKKLYPKNLFPKEKGIVKYWSLNPIIASINKKGVVTGRSSGSTSLRVKVGQCILNCNVTVIKPTTMNVDGNMTMVTGDAAQLKLLNNTFTSESNWSSSDPNVVTVTNKGVINCVNEGTAVITATNSGESFSTTITVQDPAIKFRNVNGTLQAYIKNASQPATWSTSNGAIASIDANGVLTGLSNGDVTIIGTIGDQSATYDVHVSQITIGDQPSYIFWRQSNHRLVSINKVTCTKDAYFTCDDYTNYVIGFKRYNTANPDELVVQSYWNNLGMLLNKGNTYSFLLARNEGANDQSDVPLAGADSIRIVPRTTMQHAKVPAKWMKSGVSAHRGDMTKAPENTTAAYKAAGKNKKIIAIEADIHDTADGQLVMIHDNYLARMTTISKKSPNAMKPLSALTLKQIQSYSIKATINGKTKVYKNLHIPTFSQYLDICKKYNKIAFIDLKTFNKSGSIKKMVDIINAKGMQNKVLVMGYRTGYLENIAHTPGGAGLKKCALFSDRMTSTQRQIVLQNGIGSVMPDWNKQTKSENNWCKKHGITYCTWA